MRKRFATRSAYQLEMRLADGDTITSFNEPDDFRAALQVLSQSTRFQIFRLITAHPGQLTLDEICGKISGSREKVYHHLYQMIRVKLIVVQQNTTNNKFFSPNGKFLAQAQLLFSGVGSSCIKEFSRSVESASEIGEGV